MGSGQWTGEVDCFAIFDYLNLGLSGCCVRIERPFTVLVGRDDSARRSPAIIAFLGLTIKIGRGGVLLRPSHAYLTNFQSGGAEPLPYKGLCTLEELCELHSLQFLLRRAKDRKRSSSSRPTKTVNGLLKNSSNSSPRYIRNRAPNSNLNFSEDCEAINIPCPLSTVH